MRATTVSIAIALCCAVLLLSAASAAPLPPRPSPPSQGRFPHAIVDVNAAANIGRAARNGAGTNSAGLIRRFRHQMVVDLEGRDVTADWSVPSHENEASREFADSTLAPLGLSLLQYDVEMAPNARVLDEDFNVRAVECSAVAGAPGMVATHTLDLTVEDAAAALALYAVGSVVQGSPMWACTNTESKEDPNTILMSVQFAAIVDAHTVRVTGPAATYQQLFGEAHVLLRQPSLAPAPSADAATEEHPLAKPGSVHPMAVGQTFEGKLVASGPTSDVDDVSHVGRKLLETDALNNPWGVSNEWSRKGLATYARSCADVPCSQPATSLSKWQKAMCKLCSQGRDMTFEVACDNCTIRYAAQVTLFTFSYNINPLNTLYVRGEARMEASFGTDLDVSAGITFTQRVAGTLNLISPIPIPPSIGISIGIVSITIGATFALDAGYTIDFTARASVRAQAAVSNTVTARAVYDSRNNPDASLVANIPPWTITQQPTVEVRATGELTLTLALTPKLAIGITRMITANVQTDVAVVAHANFSWPAFPLIEAPSLWDVNPLRPALWHFGDCSTPHLVRYDISAGVVNGYASARVIQSIGGAISGLLSGLDTTEEIGRIALPQVRVPLIAGCLLKQSSSEPIILVFNLPTGRNLSLNLRLDLPNLNYNLVADLATALNVSASRFIVELLDYAGQVVDRDQLVRALYEQLLPTQTTLALGHMRKTDATTTTSIAPDGSNVAAARVIVLQSDNESDLTPPEIQSRVAVQMSDPSSPLRQNSAVVSDLELSNGSGDKSSALSAAVIAGIVIGVLCAVGIGVALWYVLVYRPNHARSVTSKGGKEAQEVIPQGMVAMQTVKLHANAQSQQSIATNAPGANNGGTQLGEVHLSIRPSAPPQPPQPQQQRAEGEPFQAASAPSPRSAPPPPVPSPTAATPAPIHFRMSPAPPQPPTSPKAAAAAPPAPLSPRGPPPPPPAAAAADAPRPMTVAERMAAFEKPQIE